MLQWQPPFPGMRCDTSLVIQANNVAKLHGPHTSSASSSLDSASGFTAFWEQHAGCPLQVVPAPHCSSFLEELEWSPPLAVISGPMCTNMRFLLTELHAPCTAAPCSKPQFAMQLLAVQLSNWQCLANHFECMIVLMMHAC